MFNSFKNYFYSQPEILEIQKIPYEKLNIPQSKDWIAREYLEELYKTDKNQFKQNNIILGYINKEGYTIHTGQHKFDKNVFDLSKITKNNYHLFCNYTSAMRHLTTYNNRKCDCDEKLLHIKNSEKYDDGQLFTMYGKFNNNINYDVMYDDKTKFIHSKTNCSKI